MNSRLEKFSIQRFSAQLWAGPVVYSREIQLRFPSFLSVWSRFTIYYRRKLTTTLEWFVDVEDAARLCVIGLLNQAVNSERIFAFTEQLNWTDVVNIFRELRPDNKQIPNPPANEARDRTDILPRKRAEELLRAFGQDGFTPIKASLERGIEGLE